MWTRFNPLHSPDCRPAAPLAAGVVESQGSTGQMPPAEVERRNENIAAISQHLSSHETRLYCLQAWFWSAGIFVHHFHWNEQKQKQQVWLCTAEHGSQRWVEQNAISRCENQNWYVRRHIPFHLLSAPSCIADFSPIFGPACCAQASQTTNMKWKHRAGFQDMSGRAIENGRNDGTPASTLIAWLPTLLSRLKTYGRLTPELPQTSRCWLAWFRTPSVASNSKFSGNTLID